MKIKGICVFCALLFIPMLAFSQAVTLDNALRNSTTYLNGRIKANTKVVVLNFTSDWPRLSDYIIDELIGYVVNDGTFTVVDRNNLETIRKELNFQLSGEVSDETAQSIGKMLGAQTIINGNITAIGNAYRLRVRAISVESAQIIGMNNVDVAQDSRIAALTGTASVGPMTTVTAPSSAASAGPNVLTVILPSAWNPGGIEWDFQGTTKKLFTSREVIEGRERDVVTFEVTFPRKDGGKWATFGIWDGPIMPQIRTASGVRFKALGDGKTWHLVFNTKEQTATGDGASYRAEIKTRSNMVVDINIPFSSLKQPDWGKKVPWVKSNMLGVNIQRQTVEDTESGTSTIKVFDFEVY